MTAPLTGLKLKTLPDGSWGSLYEGDNAALPVDLVGALIAVQQSNDEPFTSTVQESSNAPRTSASSVIPANLEWSIRAVL